MNKAYIFISIFILALAGSCKKDKEASYVFTGTITDSYSSAVVSGVSVKLSGNSISGGVFNTNFDNLGSVYSESDGSFCIEISRETFNEFKITFEKDQYISQESFINPDNVDPTDGIVLNRGLDPLAEVNLTLRNVWPEADTDEITFRYISTNFDQCDCCDNVPRNFSGSSIDTTLSCTLVGGSQLDYLYTIESSGVSETITGGIFIEPFTEEDILIEY